MSLVNDLSQWRKDHFIALILDNEVTVGEFVVDPPLPWIRLIQKNDVFAVADGYPTTLSATQGRFEMKNWDQVSLPAIARFLGESGALLDSVVFGNNAGQGLPLAQALPKNAIGAHAAVIYANSLPEKTAYERLGYVNFWRRSETARHLAAQAEQSARPLSLLFINTIQHNELNYHDP